MVGEKIIGGCAVLFGALLLFWIIPREVMSVPGVPTDPSVFPKGVAWVFIVLGLLQIAFGPQTNDPRMDWPELGKLSLVILVLVAAAYCMERFGHIPAMTGLMVASVLLMFERRWYWGAVTIL